MRNKLKAENFIDNLGGKGESIDGIIQEKERLRQELEKALGDIDQLKSLLAQNTIKSLQTQEDEDKYLP